MTVYKHTETTIYSDALCQQNCWEIWCNRKKEKKKETKPLKLPCTQLQVCFGYAI